MYKLRNTIFGINASSKRKIVPNAYSQNITALSKLVNSRESLNVFTIIYIPPLLHYSSGKPIPYIKSEYDLFKLDTMDICKVDNCKFYNLESIVIDDLWGFKQKTSLNDNSKEIDFMHFTYKAHKIVFDNLVDILDNLLRSN